MREISLRKWVRRNVCVGQILSKKEIAAGPRRPEASMTKGITEAGGGVEGGAIFAYLERLFLSMCFAAPSWLSGDSVGYSMYSDAPGLTTAKSMTITSGPRSRAMSATTSCATPSASGAVLPTTLNSLLETVYSCTTTTCTCVHFQ